MASIEGLSSHLLVGEAVIEKSFQYRSSFLLVKKWSLRSFHVRRDLHKDKFVVFLKKIFAV